MILASGEKRRSSQLKIVHVNHLTVRRRSRRITVIGNTLADRMQHNGCSKLGCKREFLMLKPSLKINEKYQSQRFVIETAEVLSGVVTIADNLMIRYINNRLTAVRRKGIRVKNIAPRCVSKIRIMAIRLLDQPTRDEDFDLLE